ncbi:MAG: SIMPL domain-containing protein [Nitrospirota bacterium]
MRLCLTVVAFFLLFTSYAGAADKIPDDAGPGTISVTGTAAAYHAPDTATVVLAVETTASSVPEGIKANAKKAEAVMNALKGLVRKDAGDSVKTSHYSLQPLYDYDTRQRKNELTGYRITNQITVRTRDTALAGALVDSAIKSGANRVDSVSFSLENEEKHCRDILVRAVEQARKEAAIVAEALGVIITGVKSAAPECGVRGIQPVLRREMALAQKAASDTATPVEAGDIEVQGIVNIAFLIGK